MKPTSRGCKGILTGFMVLFFWTSATAAAKTVSKEGIDLSPARTLLFEEHSVCNCVLTWSSQTSCPSRAGATM